MFKAERNVVHGNLAFAVLVSQLVFFTGIDAAENVSRFYYPQKNGAARKTLWINNKSFFEERLQ